MKIEGGIKIYLVAVLVLSSIIDSSAAASLSNSGGGSWQYYRDITITNSGSTLSDYQVLMQLSGNYFPTTRSDGGDIRFADASGNELSYWIEIWDYSGRNARIWVKVPSLQANSGNIIRMYYGNDKASSSSNGAATFEFFDDFETLVGWITYGNKSQALTLDGKSVVTIEGWGEIVIPVSLKAPNYAFESKSKLISGMEAYMPFFGFGSSDKAYDENNAYQFGYNVYAPTFLDNIRIIKNSEWVNNQNGDNQHTVRTEWSRISFMVFGGTLKQKLDDSSRGMQEITLMDTGYWTGKIPIEIGIIVWYGSTYAVDWVFVRKYVSPEPPAAIGAEQVMPGSISVTSSPSGAEVIVDGQSKGIASPNLNVPNVAPGPHAIKCKLSGYLDYDTTATVTVGKDTPITCAHTLAPVVTAPEITTTAAKITTPGFVASSEQQLRVALASEPASIGPGQTSMILVTVVGSDGKEIPKADVMFSSSPPVKFKPVSGQTNSFGQFTSTFTAPSEEKVIVSVSVRKDGFAEGKRDIQIEIEQLETPTQTLTQTPTQIPISTSTPPIPANSTNLVSIIAVLLIIAGLVLTTLTTLKKDISLEVGVSERSLKYVGGAGILLIVIGAYILLKSYELI